MTNNNEPPKILMAIVDRDKQNKLEKLFEEKHVQLLYLANGTGTARSDLLQAFGLSGTEKTIAICIASEKRIPRLMTSVMDRMEMNEPGHGIAFTISMTAISGAVARALECTGEAKPAGEKEGPMEHEDEYGFENDTKYELVIAIVNSGFSEDVMNAARKAGARGGTILHARQAALTEAVKFFGIHTQRERELVLIITEEDMMEGVMQSITKSCGMRTDARGLTISFPLDKCVGLTPLE